MDTRREGKKWRAFSLRFKIRCKALDLPCFHCRRPIKYDADIYDPDSFNSDHYYPVSTHPHMTFMESNLVPSHRHCNEIRGNKPVETGLWVEADW